MQGVPSGTLHFVQKMPLMYLCSSGKESCFVDPTPTWSETPISVNVRMIGLPILAILSAHMNRVFSVLLKRYYYLKMMNLLNIFKLAIGQSATLVS